MDRQCIQGEPLLLLEEFHMKTQPCDGYICAVGLGPLHSCSLVGGFVSVRPSDSVGSLFNLTFLLVFLRGGLI